MHYRLLGSKVLVVDDPITKKTSKGLLLPTGSQTSRAATVIVVGPGEIMDNGKRRPMDVRVGDRVLVSKGGIEVKHGRKKARLVDIRDIIAVHSEIKRDICVDETGHQFQ